MHLHPHNRGYSHRMSMRSRSPSPTRRPLQPHEVGFSDAVSDMVELVREETSRRGRARRKLRGDEFSLSSPVRFRPGYHDSALSPSTPDRGNSNGFLPPNRYVGFLKYLKFHSTDRML